MGLVEEVRNELTRDNIRRADLWPFRDWGDQKPVQSMGHFSGRPHRVSPSWIDNPVALMDPLWYSRGHFDPLLSALRALRSPADIGVQRMPMVRAAAFDVQETEQSYIMSVELPGIKKDDIKVLTWIRGSLIHICV